MDQDGVAGLASAALEQVGPDGEVGFGDGGRLDHAQAVGNGQTQAAEATAYSA